MEEITLRQKLVLKTIELFVRSNGFSPTTREIADALSMNQNGVAGHLKALKRKGRVTWKPGLSRTITIL